MASLVIRWTGALLTAGGLLIPTAAESSSVPIFCIDITEKPTLALTGCGDGIIRSHLPPAPAAPAAWPDMVISGEPQTHERFGDPPLVQVGPKALIRVADAAGPQGSAAGRKGSSPSGNAPPSRSPASPFGLLTPGDRWTYLHLDQDGTYLFLGESPPTVEQIPFADENDPLPDGIGIGKKWRF